ncbi:hypothetical protein ADIS_4320 [Lunatimonas lonarensis]|uniref:Uncharacterized protein n=1 Tax=Lunatimonas lonarensis TaxID=1232681 RepID=R7ZMB5_9BACT|nr:hypothetical protein [Lunatimonas lonarensis]EON75149.1 hypothetical protein ADIS_4320 [Lunatimonas lonarensis]
MNNPKDNPKSNRWQGSLPEHFPDEKIWASLMASRCLESQVAGLKGIMPIYAPKEDLWAGIERELSRKNRFRAFFRISAAAMLVVGFWGINQLANRQTYDTADFLITQVSNDNTIDPIPLKIELPGPDPKIYPSQKDRKKYQPISAEMIEKVGMPLDIEILKTRIEVIELTEPPLPATMEIDQPMLRRKKTVAVVWEVPIRKVRIEGLEVELSDKELAAIQEIKMRKKGKLRIQINSLSARLYEKE